MSIKFKNLPITEHLVTDLGFTFIRPTKEWVEGDVPDFDHYSCMIRLHECHYLFFSEHLKHFTIAYKYPKPKGKAGGGYDEFKKVIIPKVIDSCLAARKLYQALI